MAIKPIYYCSECKKLLESGDDLLFVEDNSSKGFCSEKCIESYYEFLGVHYVAMDSSLRADLNLKDEDALDYVGVPRLMEKALQNPEEIWCQANTVGDTVYSFIYREETDDGRDLYYILMCLVYNKRPAYIIHSTATFSEALVQGYRIGSTVENVNDYTPGSSEVETALQISQETMDHLEQKKSSFLANLMEQRKESDIPFETFTLYSDYYTSTLEAPDEIYKSKDEDSDDVYVYIKAHDRDGISFFFFVICTVAYNEMTEKSALFPVLSFPTIDPSLHRYYRRGEKLSGGLSN